MNSKYLLVALFAALSIDAWSQTSKTVLVEHYTNTRCSNCASRNPAFFTNLNAQSNTIHIAYHPSSPYSSCVLNKHNTVENDDRTRFYGVYGGTPRIVIQGSVISGGSNYGSASIFNPYKDQTSPFSLRSEVNEIDEGLEVTVTLKKVSADDLQMASILTHVVEDTVFYDAPNGEKEHYNVFRKKVFDRYESMPNVGDSIQIKDTVAFHADWKKKAIKVISYVQNMQLEVLQATESNTLAAKSGSLNVKNVDHNTIHVYPNPASRNVHISSKNAVISVELHNVVGATVLQTEQTDISVEGLEPGIYFLNVNTNSGIYTRRLLIE